MRYLIIGCLLFFGFGSPVLFAQKPDVDKALSFVLSKAKGSCLELKDSAELPRSVPPGGNHWNTTDIHDWTSGFFPGYLWYTYEFSKDESIKTEAIKWTSKLEPVQFHNSDHDIGFMMYCSYGNGLRITGNKSYKPIVLQSAKSLMTRFNHKTGLICSWDHLRSYGYYFPVIIDNMMNLELLFWAAKNGGGKEMYQAAVSHAEKTMRYHFREDATTYHVVNYDTTTGRPTRKFTWQGYQNISTWSRGQAWAIYGFTVCYRETKDPRFLKTAKDAADWYLAHLPSDLIPYWDFNAPYIPNEERDASAAAIVASALLELAEFTKGDEQKKYFVAAERMLSTLSTAYVSTNCLHNAVLLHSVGGKPYSGEVDYSINYADYYYIEALIRYKKSYLKKKYQ